MFSLSLSFPSHNQPSTHNYGSDFDRLEAGRIFLTAFPAHLSDQSIDQVDPEDFKMR